MVRFKGVLSKSYLDQQDMDHPTTKMEYLGNTVFDFTTYDGEIDAMFAEKMIEVLECILDRTTFEYQENRKQYLNYLTMVNMPFLADKLDWGTSIRGAYFNDCREYKIDYDRIIIKKQELTIFIKDMIEWAKEV